MVLYLFADLLNALNKSPPCTKQNKCSAKNRCKGANRINELCRALSDAEVLVKADEDKIGKQEAMFADFLTCIDPLHGAVTLDNAKNHCKCCRSHCLLDRTK